MTEQTQVRGLMMKAPLGIGAIADRAQTQFGRREVVSRTASGEERFDYATVVERARRLASSLRELGVRPGDRVASFAWNSVRHLELYLAVPSVGAVLHTVNVRLHQDEIAYLLDHADDKVVFADASVRDNLPHSQLAHILMPDDERDLGADIAYEQLIAAGDPSFEFPIHDEESAAMLCYTSGTTGNPKGCLYSHRSLALYVLMANQPDSFGITENDVVMPVVPMFHANSWGMPYIAAMVGAKLVLPGPAPSPRVLGELIASEQVTISGAVPTVWQGVLDLRPSPDLSSVRELVVGGSQLPETLLRGFGDRGVAMTQGWGMTETSPLALISRIPTNRHLDDDERIGVLAKQGRPIPFVEARINDVSGGELQVRGPSIVRDYYLRPEDSPLTADGWLSTGDIAVIDDDGYIKLTDRTKDLIKSGGEWISSVELETSILAHPDVIEAAVVAMPHSKWGERPCMFVRLREGTVLGLSEVREFLVGIMPSWSLPDRLVIVDDIPKTSVGKFDKKLLRASLPVDV